MEKKKVIIIIVISVAIALVVGYFLGSMTKTTSSNIPPIIGDNLDVEENDEKQSKEPTTINLGEKIKNSDIEMTFKAVNFKNEIKWKTSEYSSRSESIGEGKVALSISGTFKNLRGSAINDNVIIGKAIVDDKYTYDLSFAPHTSGYQIDPLENKDYDFFAEVPKEIKKSYSKVEFIFGYNNDFETVSTQYINGKIVDKYKNLDNLYSLTVKK